MALLVLDIYSHAIGLSPKIDDLLLAMKSKVQEEVRQSMTACRIGGMVGMLVGGGGGEQVVRS